MTFTDQTMGWTLSIDATTAGLTDLGHGWYGYVVLAPAVKADIIVQAYAFNTAVIDERQVTAGDGSDPASATASAMKMPMPAMTSAVNSHIPAACNDSGPAYAISDVGATRAFVVFRVSTDAGTLCFFDGSAWSTAVRRAGTLSYLGYSKVGAEPTAFGAFDLEADSVTTEAAVFDGGSSTGVPSRAAGGLTFFVAPAGSPTILVARTATGSSLARVQISAAPSR